MARASWMLVAGALALAGLAAGPSQAHHGWGSYDAAKTVEVKGTLKEVAWGSPHVTVQMDHDGREVTVVLAPPTRMQTRGLSPEMVAKGAAVSLDAYPLRDGGPEFRAERIRVGDKTVELR